MTSTPVDDADLTKTKPNRAGLAAVKPAGTPSLERRISPAQPEASVVSVQSSPV